VDIGRGVRRGRSDRARKLLGGVGRLGEAGCGCFEFGRCGRHGLDNVTDRRLEFVRKLSHRELACGLLVFRGCLLVGDPALLGGALLSRGARLRISLLCLETKTFDRVGLEDPHGLSHLPDLVTAVAPRHFETDVAACQHFHGGAQRGERSGDAARHGDDDRKPDRDTGHHDGSQNGEGVVRLLIGGRRHGSEVGGDAILHRLDEIDSRGRRVKPCLSVKSLEVPRQPPLDDRRAHALDIVDGGAGYRPREEIALLLGC
jgi:hypothetical protein